MGGIQINEEIIKKQNKAQISKPLDLIKSTTSGKTINKPAQILCTEFWQINHRKRGNTRMAHRGVYIPNSKKHRHQIAKQI